MEWSRGSSSHETKLANYIRLLGSNRAGEVVAAANALIAELKKHGEDLHDMAERRANPKLSEVEMRKIYDAGLEAGIRKAEAAQIGDGDFRSIDGTPPWEEIATWLQRYDDQHNRLGERERDFVNDMAALTLWRTPSERQARWLLGIFRKMGGGFDE